MVICQTLDEARAVPGVIAIVSGEQIKAYVQGDVLPPEAVIDPAAVAAEITRTSAIETNIATNTFGSVQPATVAQLKAMTFAEYSAWFDANVSTAAQAIALLKRLTIVIIRRVL